MRTPTVIPSAIPNFHTKVGVVRQASAQRFAGTSPPGTPKGFPSTLSSPRTESFTAPAGIGAASLRPRPAFDEAAKREALESLKALREQQDNMQVLMQQHRDKLAHHEAVLFRALEHQPRSAPASGSSKREPTEGLHSVRSTTRLKDESYEEDYEDGESTDGLSPREGLGLPTAVCRWMNKVTKEKILEPNRKIDSFSPKNKLQATFFPIVHSPMFELFVFWLIIFSIVTLAIELNVMVTLAMEGRRVDVEFREWHNLDYLPELHYLKVLRTCESVILALFGVEIALRILAEQRDFIMGDEMLWNLGDIAATLICIAFSIKDHHSDTVGKWDSLRFIRIVRIMRVLRMVRMFKFLRKLRVMLYSFVACFTGLFWASILFFSLVACFAIVLEDQALYHLQLHNIEEGCLREHEGKPVGQDCHLTDMSSETWTEVHLKLQAHWNGMPASVMSLIFSCTGGADWADMAEPFCLLSPWLCSSYVVFVVIVILGLINITVGIFAQQAKEFHHYDPQLIVEGALADHESMRDMLYDLFDRVDVAHDGKLEFQDIKKSLEDRQIKAYFAELNIDVEMHPQQFFSMIDTDGSGRVDREEFAKACMRMKGGAKTLELVKVQKCVEEIQSQLHQLSRSLPAARPRAYM